MNRTLVTKVVLGTAMVAGVGAALAHDLRVASIRRGVADHCPAPVAMAAHGSATAMVHIRNGAQR